MSNRRWQKIKQALPNAVFTLLMAFTAGAGSRHLLVLAILLIWAALIYLLQKWGGE